MTCFATVSIVCAHCSHHSSGRVLLSTNSCGGSPALDTRTCGMARAATLAAIQCCPECSYCSTDLTQISDGSTDLIQTSRYRDTFRSSSLPELCRKWSCWAQILEASQRYSDAGWMFLSTAWACDDARHLHAAVTYRHESIRLFQTARSSHQPFANDSETETTIFVDLHRRVGNFASASQLAHATLAMLEREPDNEQPLMQAINRFQLHLLSIGDTRSYSYAEAERFAKKPSTWRLRQWREI
jgi:hypothetical protein